MNYSIEPSAIGVLDVAERLGTDVETQDESLLRARLLGLDVDTGVVPAEVLRHVANARGRISGYVLMEGLIVADLALAGRTATQLLGPGDVFGASTEDDALLTATRRFGVAQPARLAVLDERFLAACQRWPALGARVIEGAVRQLERAATHQAISQLSRVELRLLALMWHLAERWGRVTAGGYAVTLDLTHAALGQLIGAKRPTVSLALKWLDAEGALTRRPDGTWLINGESAELLGSETQQGSVRMTAPQTASVRFARGDAGELSTPPA